MPLLLKQHISELKTTKHCCDYSFHHPLPSHFAFIQKKKIRDKHWWCCSVYLYMKYCLPEHRRNEKQGTVFLAPKSLLSFFLSLWDVLHEHTATEFLSGVLLLFSCPLHSFSHSHLHHHKQVITFWDTASWWRQLQLNFREFSLPSVINGQCWVYQLSTSVPISPYCDTRLSWDHCCSPFLPFASRTTSEILFFTKTGWLSALTWTMGLSLGG